MTALKHLYARPSSLCVDLSGCRIGGVIPAFLGRIKSLTFLGISNNFYTGQVPPSFGGLSNLAYLDISGSGEEEEEGNGLGSPLPSQLTNLKALQSLQLLFLSHNPTPTLCVRTPTPPQQQFVRQQ
ncbi:unnamed protein product [Closterium sp. Naga37s-1]|nr:unnamed protein product [Closterium sp. Naga37s-1]